MTQDRLQQLAFLASIPVLLILLLAIWLAIQLRFGTEFVENWLPASAPSRVAMTDFSERFGNDQVLLLSWVGATLDDPRIQKATQQLEVLKAQNPEWPIASITNSQASVEALCNQLQNLSPAEAVRRLAGHAVGKDGSSFIAISFREYQPLDRDQIIAAAIQVACQLGIDQRDLVLAGEPYQTHIIDHYSRWSVERLVPISVVISLITAWLCLRDLRLTFMVLALAGIGQLVGMSLISALVGQMGAILVVVPTLLFTLTLSAAVHLIHYYVGCTIGHQSHPAVRGVEMGFLPCIMAAATTAIGFLSLTTSQLEPVYQFGTLSAIGMSISIAFLVILFVPACRIQEIRRCSVEGIVVKPLWAVGSLLNLAIEYATWITAIGFILLIFFAAGLWRLQSTTRFDSMLPPHHPCVTSLRWIEQHVSPIESLELVIGFSRQPQPLDVLQQLSIVTHLQESIEKHEVIHSSFAANCILPSVPRQQGSRATIRRSIFRRVLTNHWQSLEDASLISSDAGGDYWRITARFKTVTDADFHRLRSEIESLARKELDSMLPGATPQASLVTTGLRTVIETTNTTLIRDLVLSFATAFLLITPVMMLVARSVLGGILLMLPNLLPVILVFGAMGWLSIPLDVASILTASVALGIAVDDTLHCTHWYLQFRRKGSSATEAITEALQKCARPMFHTTLICTGAMIPFLFCEFLPTGKFATLMIVILMSAIIGDLILLPSILCSPIGSWIGSKRSEDDALSRNG